MTTKHEKPGLRVKAALRTVAAAALMLAVASPAFASSCPLEMQKIDQAMAAGYGASLGEYKLDKVKELRAEGERLHKEGKHAESLKALRRAEQMLGIK